MTSRDRSLQPPDHLDQFRLEIDRNIIVVHGSVDAGTAGRLADAIELVRRMVGPVVIDTSDVEVFAAAAVGVLAVATRDSRGGHLAVRNPAPTVRKVLEIVDFAHLIESE